MGSTKAVSHDKSVKADVKPPKNNFNYSTRQIAAITVFVVGLLLGAAAVTTWQLGVGGTGQWITFTLTGTSGALLMGVAIGMMIASCKKPNSSQPQAKSGHKGDRTSSALSSAPKPKAQVLPSSTASHVSSEPAITEAQKAHALDRCLIHGELDALKRVGLTPLSPRYDGKPIIASAITGNEVYLVCQMTADFKLDQLALTYPYLPALPSNSEMIKVFVARFETCVDEYIKKNEPIPTQHLPTNGVYLVTENLIRKCIVARADKTLASILPNYPKLISDDLVGLLGLPNSIEESEKLDALRRVFVNHRRQMHCAALAEVCQNGPVKDVIHLMYDDLQLMPRDPLPSGETTFSLIVRSGKVELLKDFIQWLEATRIRFFVTQDDIALAITCKVDAVTNFLEMELQAHNKKKAEELSDFATLASDTRLGPKEREPLGNIGSAASTVDIDDVVLDGPHKGKTILQIAVEANATENIRNITWNAGRKKVSTTHFFLGRCSFDTIDQFCGLSTSTREEVIAQKTKQSHLDDIARFAQWDQNKNDVLKDMQTHGVTPEMTVASGKTLLQHTAEHGSVETLKAMIPMLKGKRLEGVKTWNVKPNILQELEPVIAR